MLQRIEEKTYEDMKLHRVSKLEDRERKIIEMEIEKRGFNRESAFVLSWIPDQDQQGFVVWVSPYEILSIEIKNNTDIARVRIKKVSDYQKNANKINNHKIYIARKILNERGYLF